jgi:hypothetical protein
MSAPAAPLLTRLICALPQFVGGFPLQLAGQVFELAGQPLGFFKMLGIHRIHGLLLFSFDPFGLVLKSLGKDLFLIRREGLILAQGGPDLLLGCRDPFIGSLLQSRICCLQRGYPFLDSRLRLGRLARQFLPDLCRQLLSLVALSSFNPMSDLFGVRDWDRLIAVGTLGWQRVRINGRLTL